MSKTISVSDEVYKQLQREKGDKSFSEVIEAKLDENTRLMDVTGNRVLDRETMENVKKVLSKHTGSP